MTTEAEDLTVLEASAGPSKSGDSQIRELEINMAAFNLSSEEDPIPKITRIRILDDDYSEVSSSFQDGGEECDGDKFTNASASGNEERRMFKSVDPATMEHVNQFFVTDPATISLLKKSKVMFILRGIPGSGKSHVASGLQFVYPDIARCSASYYFFKSGEYQTGRTREDQVAAHGECQQMAENACKAGRRLLIDNCHTHLWEMACYLKLAKSYNYITLVVEPNTPWKKDPTEAANRINGVVGLDIIRQKLKHWQNYVPKFFAWFVNAVDTKVICNIANDVYRRCHQVPEIRKVMTAFGLSADPAANYIGNYSASGSDPILYCVTYYSNFGKKAGGDTFAMSKMLHRAHGRATELRISGLVLTASCFLARVMLDDEQNCLVNHRFNTPLLPNSRPTATTSWRSRGNANSSFATKSPAEDDDHVLQSRTALLPENPDGDKCSDDGDTESTCRWKDPLLSTNHRAGAVSSNHGHANNKSRAHILLGSNEMIDCALTAISDIQFVCMNEEGRRRPPVGATTHASFDLDDFATVVNYGSEALAVNFKRHLVVRAVLASSSDAPVQNTNYGHNQRFNRFVPGVGTVSK